MSTQPQLAMGVDIIELTKGLVVVKLAHWVLVGPLYSSKYPPAQFCTRWVSSLFGRIVDSCLQYVTLLPAGKLDFGMKNMVSDLGLRRWDHLPCHGVIWLGWGRILVGGSSWFFQMCHQELLWKSCLQWGPGVIVRKKGLCDSQKER